MSVKLKLWFVFVAGFGLLLPFTSFAKTIRVKSAAGIKAEFDESAGRYQITVRRPDWKFAGELGRIATNAVVNTGTDLIGPYQEISFAWRAGIPMTGGIRVYDGRAVVLFTLTHGQAAEKPAAPFPRFTSFPAALHHFSFGNSPFAPPRFKLETNGTPWLLFDDHANAALISPANNFLIASMSGDGVNEIASGLNAGVCDVPADFSHSTLIAFGSGIHSAWNSWSAAFLALQGAPRPANDGDPGLRYLGYWTDNGAAYYYNCQTNLGYAGTLENWPRVIVKKIFQSAIFNWTAGGITRRSPEPMAKLARSRPRNCPRANGIVTAACSNMKRIRRFCPAASADFRRKSGCRSSRITAGLIRQALTTKNTQFPASPPLTRNGGTTSWVTSPATALFVTNRIG